MTRLAMILLLLLGSPAAAQTIRVRSGEHETFSRLVFDLPPSVEWRIETAGDVIRLSPGSAALRFNFDDVFTLIPKTRIRSIGRDRQSGDIVVGTTGVVHMNSFETANGSVVVDVITGPAPETAGGLKTAALPTLPPVIPEPAKVVPKLHEQLPTYWRRHLETENTQEQTEQHPATSLPSISHLPDVQQAEQELLHQIGRAAAQGLVRIDTSRSALPSGAGERHAEDGFPTDAEGDHVAIQSRTVIDRDNAVHGVAAEFSDAGVVCYSDAQLDITAWLGDAPVASQIGAARLALVGEFDRASDTEVARLAKLYVAAGFGAEARALLEAMSTEPDAAILDLSALVEDRPVAPTSRLPAMIDCDGSAALWAVLATPVGGVVKGKINEQAVTRAFSALPAYMREWQGPELAKRLIAADAISTAETIRAALSRSPDTRDAALQMMNAQINLAKGDMDSAAPELRKLSTEDGDGTADAALLFALATIDRGEAVEAGVIETLGALAFEHGSTPRGAELRKAHILALGAASRFSEAFDALERWPKDQAEDLRAESLQGVYERLATTPESAQFLTQVFADANLDDQADLAPETRLRLAERLLDEGFAEAAKRHLKEDLIQAEQGRILMARISLAGHDAPATIAHLVGIDSEPANALRQEALHRITGAKRDALAISAPQQGPSDPNTLTPADGAPVDGGPAVDTLLPGLAAARSLLEHSVTEREELEALLQRTEDSGQIQ